jgi:hypothetical protein
MKIKFFTVPHDHPKVRYQHELVALAEGLRELGNTFFASDNYWKEPGKDYLLEKSEAKADINIYTSFYFSAFPDAISNVDYNRINVLIDREDGLYGEYCNPHYVKFDLILRTHYNRHINYNHYHKNIQPWAFGLTNRIMDAIDESKGIAVKDQVLVNFRIAHDVRKMAGERFTPIVSKKFPVIEKQSNDANLEKDEKSLLYWQQSGKRHDPEYFKMLNESLLTYAFGGFIYQKPFAYNRLIKQVQRLNSLYIIVLKMLGINASNAFFIDQFDSWRFWEALYSQTCPLHMDFKTQGWVLPVMPENKVHYWGVEGFEFEKSASELLSLHSEKIRQMGLNGKKWSKEHYSPLPTAQRFLKYISEIEKSK